MPLSKDQILRIPLIPVLAAQALYVRSIAQKLPEPPGPRQGHAGAGEKLSLLILGDSSAAGVGASTQANALSGQLVEHLSQRFDMDWHLLAETGATTKSNLGKLPDLPPTRFEVAVLVHGVNDTTRLTSKATFKARQTRLMEHLRAQHGTQLFVLSGLPPMHHFPLLPQPLRWVLGCHAERLDRALSELARDRGDCTHLALDLPYEPRFIAQDGFHPSEEAYREWAHLVADTLLECLSDEAQMPCLGVRP
ncbi:SGNH/GDSL hydrolase family protein [Shimia sp. SDUM112013]|uniref:SGNH/GDSL hydrolase family protein n=1 Tax=Shimia sp. SDUM112013 TaxID=3136160 RepID=UPI0032EFBF1B